MAMSLFYIGLKWGQSAGVCQNGPFKPTATPIVMRFAQSLPLHHMMDLAIHTVNPWNIKLTRHISLTLILTMHLILIVKVHIQ